MRQAKEHGLFDAHAMQIYAFTRYLMGYFSPRRQEVSGTISDWIVRGIQGVIR